MIKAFYFFDSYRNALRKYHEAGDYESQAILIHAICDYIFEGTEPNFPRPDFSAMWELLLPHLQESIRIEKEKEKKRAASIKGAEIANQKKKEKKANAHRTGSECTPNGERTWSECKNENEKENKNTDIPVPSPVVTEKDIIQFYLDTGLQSKFLKADMTLSDFAVKNITAYTEKNECGINTENFEDYKKYAIACYNKAKEGAGLKGS